MIPAGIDQVFIYFGFKSDCFSAIWYLLTIMYNMKKNLSIYNLTFLQFECEIGKNISFMITICFEIQGMSDENMECV